MLLLQTGVSILSHVIQMQSNTRSAADQSKLCSFDHEVIEAPTNALIHEEGRFLWVKKGRGVITVQSRPHTLEPGTLLCVLPWQITQVTQVEEPLQYYLVVYHLDSLNKLIKSFTEPDGVPAKWISDITASPAVHCDRRQAAAMEAAFQALADELGMESAYEAPETKPFGSIAAMSRLINIVVLYERFGRSTLPDFGEAGANLDHSEILRYMYAHCNEKLSLKKLSRIFYCSESSLGPYISGMTGLSFFDLLNEMRIGKTANYLLYTDLTVEELAEILGYVDASHLSKVFSARVGMKINDYRKTYQKVCSICKIDEGRRTYEVVAYIYRNFREPLTVQSVSGKFGLKIPELNRILLYQVEQNFDGFLHTVRINRACELLLKTNLSVTDVALEVGYNTAKTFTRNFLRLKVMTPGDFRKTVKEV